eukprot:TRINITY_DN861_c0_g1_i4.p1 TRINITY_DN861_c0_g1~~TRINITY_DN861_c0_g1_i4.p1  ORF type:complete len:659 (+),score=156.31 TRINITY_DN861_c0_g1_i4:3448-5424(+)
MKTASLFILTLLATLGLPPSTTFADKIIDSDFSKGGFEALGWKADGAWDVFTYRDVARNPGAVARFAANKPAGSLTRTFAEITNPDKLTLSLDCGWGWGDAAQGADSISFLLLDAKGNGYAFKFHRTKANWAVQWSKATNGSAPNEMNWSPGEIDVTHPAVHDGGGLFHVEITREADGVWTIHGKDWNKGAGGTVHFTDATTSSFQKLVLLGTQNFDEQLFNKILLTTGSSKATPTVAQPTSAFLNSIGICTSFPDRGQPLPKTVEMVKYCGFRWVRGGIEGLTTDGPTTLQTYLDLHRQTGVKFSWGLVSGGNDIKKLIDTAIPLAEADALLAFEGNNEPNNWGVTYLGEAGGGQAPSWIAVAKLQRDMYAAVKNNSLLKKYPVWSISEPGGQTDNVGLQFLVIPAHADTAMPAGTRFADFANVHNYIYHPGSPGIEDNKTWNAADPTAACKVDGLFGNYGVTWAKHFRGYPEADLLTLPRVTTETGCTIEGPITEEIQALNLLSLYLAQFKRGWSYTSVYLLRDRADEAGNQTFGYFKPDYTPRKAAVYLHNLTSILADRGSTTTPAELNYSISPRPSTVHDLLLQKSDGTFQLVIWNERLKGSDEVTVRFASKLGTVNVYDPTIGTDTTSKHANIESLKLTLSNHPLILEISVEQ